VEGTVGKLRRRGPRFHLKIENAIWTIVRDCSAFLRQVRWSNCHPCGKPPQVPARYVSNSVPRMLEKHRAAGFRQQDFFFQFLTALGITFATV
jgi:hypothetical protein